MSYLTLTFRVFCGILQEIADNNFFIQGGFEMLKRIAILSISVFFILGVVTTVLTGADVANAQSCKGKKVEQANADACKTACETSCSAASKKCCPGDSGKWQEKHSAIIKKMSTTMSHREAKRLVLEGEYVCGKCSFEELDVCQGFIKTGDGSLYPLIKNGKLKGMCKVASEKKNNKFEVVGRVKIINGIKYLNVTKIAEI
jgi:hypothetical protein